MLVGVAAAGLMGVGLGLWARPAMSERQVAVAPLPIAESAGPRSIQIVLEDTPAPLGKLIEVLPAGSAAPKFVMPTVRPPPEPLAPVHPLAGLLRVQAVEPLPEEPVASPPKAFPKAAPKPAPGAVAEPVEKPKAKLVKVVAPKAEAAPKPEPNVIAKLVEKPVAELVKVAAPKAKAKPIQIEKVKLVEEAKARPVRTREAKAEPKPDKSTVRLAKADRREEDGRREKAADVEKAVAKKPARLNGPVHVIERAAPKAEAPAKLDKVKMEKPKAKAGVKTPLKAPVTAPAKARVKAPVRAPVKTQVEKATDKAKPAPAPKPIRGAGPVRFAKAMPHSDFAANDADRQMNRAYTTARAAGVPDWQLRRQQARWEQARAAAAREAPWAVQDVYLARIAQLHDLTKDAKRPGY